jgi:ubiquinone/menaquinone biosynthesis C-methylase UbiE
MSIYKDYAQVYDQSGQLAFSLKMIPYLNRLLAQHPVEGKVMLELACGTGTVALAYAEAGWRVYGVDGSPDMLAQARAKAAECGANVLWSAQDMRQFVLPERIHLSTCLYDSLNYMLTSEDLLAVFRRVAAALQPGGLFLFDMNTAWALATQWDDETYVTDADNLTVIFQSAYAADRQRVSVVATCFQRLEGGEIGAQPTYRKIVEHHTEQAYPPEQVATLLTDAGLQVEASYDCFTFKAPSPATCRILWVARSPARPYALHR